MHKQYYKTEPESECRFHVAKRDLHKLELIKETKYMYWLSSHATNNGRAKRKEKLHQIIQYTTTTTCGSNILLNTINIIAKIVLTDD